jgi:hypothetical protein
MGMGLKGGTRAPPVLPTGTQTHVKSKDPAILTIWPVISTVSRRFHPAFNISQWALAWGRVNDWPRICARSR